MREGAIAERELDDGRELVVYQMIFTWRLVIGAQGAGTYDDAWCYDHLDDALMACAKWDGEGEDPPYGWVRHIGSGRRRPGGDPLLEYVEH